MLRNTYRYKGEIMRSNSRKRRDEFNAGIESTFRKHKARKAAKLRLKRMNGGYKCDKEYEEVVVPYWERFGYKPAKYWFEMYCDREQKIDPRYIPNDLYLGELVPYFSNAEFRRFGEDKCYHDVWFPEMKRPATICKNIAGVFYDADMNVIDKEQALRLCLEFNDEFLIKPSVDSGEGRLIVFFEPGEANLTSLTEVFNDIDCNFVVQAAVKQHPLLARLNESSVNTIRPITFFFEGEVHLLSINLRIGGSGSKVDNVGAGGYACAVEPDGSVRPVAINRKSEEITATESGIKFSEIEIPNFDEIIKLAKESQKKLAHFKLIGWDFSVDEAGDPVLIEFNTCPGMNQMTYGPMFGDLTDKVLEEYFITKTLKNAQN